MDNERLQDFVTKAAARGRITFGDLRRLQRDYLPDGVSSWDEAELLIRLDAAVSRTDKAWTDWFVGAILDFALSSEEPGATDCAGDHDRLISLLAETGTSTIAGRRIAREIQRGCGSVRPMLRISPKTRLSQPLPCIPVEGLVTELGLAA